MIQEAIRKLVERQSLAAEEMGAVIGAVMDGGATDAQKSALLVALRMKGETVDEIVGAARAMRERVIAIRTERANVVDTCGTGGDGRGTFNVSTVAAFVTAAGGATVAKHGNRAVSSSCGSADVLAALGVKIDLDPPAMAKVLDRAGISFLFAPKLHPAMSAVAAVRRELGLRTIFNILGPLTNPAFAKRQVLGVYSRQLAPVVAGALAALGSEHALVVHSADGLDEISISAETFIEELTGGRVVSRVITPEEIGVTRHALEEIGGGDAATNAAIARNVLGGAAGAAREIVVANAGAALYVSGVSGSLREGVEAARAAIDSGKAIAKLEELVRLTNEL